MTSANRELTLSRPQLPALSYLDVSNIKQNEDVYQGGRSTDSRPHSNAPLAGQADQHAAAPPPPPYSHPSHQHASPWVASTRDHTPPMSRKPSGGDHEDTRQTATQTLPSISEAVGRGIFDNQMTHPSPISVAQAPSLPLATQVPPSQSGTPRSPRAARRSYPMEPPHAQSQTQPPFPSFRQDSAGPQHTPTDPAQPVYRRSPDYRPAVPASTPQQPRTQPSSYPYPRSPSPQFERQMANPAGSMPPPQPSTFAYGYTPYPPRYAQPAPHSNSGPIYQPSTQSAAPPTPATTWKSETASSRYQDERPAPAAYGESVKRHLDMYDLEAALTEVT